MSKGKLVALFVPLDMRSGKVDIDCDHYQITFYSTEVGKAYRKLIESFLYQKVEG